MKSWLTWLFTRSKQRQPRYERRLRTQISTCEQLMTGLRQDLQDRKEEIRRLQSTNRIQQVEIDELTAVIARNLERVKAETHVLGNPTRQNTGLNRSQEIEDHA